MSPKPKKCKQMKLQVGQKLELIRKLERGRSVKSVYEECGVKKLTMSEEEKEVNVKNSGHFTATDKSISLLVH